MSNLELRHGILADSDCLKEYINRQKVEELEGTKEDIRKDHYKEYQHKYYMTVTKRKRMQKKKITKGE